MAAVTKNLAFGITASTSFEQPFLLAKRFSTLDHLTKGRLGWNIVTSYKKAAFKAIGLDTPIEHDERYQQADEFLRVLYKYVPNTLFLRSIPRLTSHLYETGFGKDPGHQMRFRPTQKRTPMLIPIKFVRSITRGNTTR